MMINDDWVQSSPVIRDLQANTSFKSMITYLIWCVINLNKQFILKHCSHHTWSWSKDDSIKSWTTSTAMSYNPIDHQALVSYSTSTSSVTNCLIKLIWLWSWWFRMMPLYQMHLFSSCYIMYLIHLAHHTNSQVDNHISSTTQLVYCWQVQVIANVTYKPTSHVKDVWNQKRASVQGWVSLRQCWASLG